jgi:hypothetical protein
MKRDQPTEGVAGIGFDLTDTVLTEIDTQLAKLMDAHQIGSDAFDLDFGAALDPPEPRKR